MPPWIPRSSRSLVLFALFGLLFRSAFAESARAISFTPIAVDGQQAPGFAAGTVYQLSSFVSSGLRLGANGTVAFEAGTTGTVSTVSNLFVRDPAGTTTRTVGPGMRHRPPRP
jgi:hypothetical protein